MFSSYVVTFQISVNYKARPRHYSLLTPRRRRMGKCVARGSKKALVDQCYADPETKKFIMKKIGRVLKEEVKKMCSSKVNSVLSSQSKDVLKTFKWNDLTDELIMHAPTLMNVLYSCTETKSSRDNRTAIICTCAAIIFKHRFPHMSLIQRIISLILHAGHCGKQVNTCIHATYIYLMQFLLGCE